MKVVYLDEVRYNFKISKLKISVASRPNLGIENFEKLIKINGFVRNSEKVFEIAVYKLFLKIFNVDGDIATAILNYYFFAINSY